MTAFERQIEVYDRVKIWLDDFKKSWGDATGDRRAPELGVLGAFCEFVGKDPTPS